MKLRWLTLFILSLLIIPGTAACTITSTSVSGPGQANPYAINVEVLAKGLDIPWAIDFAPDGRIFITERQGRVRVIKDGSLLQTSWISIETTATNIFGESGLLGLAVDPDFASNKYIYVAYTYRDGNGGLGNRLVRLKEDPATGTGISDKIIPVGARGAANHDGGRVKFGPDGKLYWTVGETQNPPLAQDLSSLNGKILRLNPDGTIPPDNPFSGSPVYSYGHRNPQGLAWQPATGRLYATEHGPTGEKGVGQDEVNYIEPGKNYGWPVISGDETHEGMVSPVIQSGSGETWAPSGATFIKSGPWAGSLLYVGLRGQTLYRLSLDSNDPRKVLGLEKLLAGKYGRLRDIVQGPDGAIYVLTSNRDGRGQPTDDDDRLLKLTVK